MYFSKQNTFNNNKNLSTKKNSTNSNSNSQKKSNNNNNSLITHTKSSGIKIPKINSLLKSNSSNNFGNVSKFNTDNINDIKILDTPSHSEFEEKGTSELNLQEEESSQKEKEKNKSKKQIKKRKKQ